MARLNNILKLSLSDEVKLSYDSEIDFLEDVNYHDNISLSVIIRDHIYCLERANYFVVFDDLVEIINDYESNTLFAFEEEEHELFNRGLGYYINMLYSEVNVGKNIDQKIIKRLNGTSAFLFGRPKVSKILTCCYKYKDQFFMEFSTIYPLGIPDNSREIEFFKKWVNTEYKVIDRVSMSDQHLITIKNQLVAEMTKCRND